MSSPRIEIELSKLAHNARTLVSLFGSKGIHLTAITKGVCGSLEIANALFNGGIRSFGDSHLSNIIKLRDGGIIAEFILIRSPMLHEIEQVVEYADISLNTELSVIRILSEQATKQGKIHRVILMVELGDLREGILPADLDSVVNETIKLPGIILEGFGTNLACFGGVRPTDTILQELSSIARNVQQNFDIKLRLISGGNSANYHWFISTSDVGLVNHLRLGESILMGCEALNRDPIPNLYSDAFTLVAEVIESKSKPSKPWGEVAQDAFGNVPVFEDKGIRHRAILAIGKQDIDISSIKPRKKVNVIGASSDHLIVDTDDSEDLLEVGAEIRFDVGYSAMLRAMLSPYVEKVYLP